jgi:hypothetical protein
MELEERAAKIEEAVLIMKDLLVSHDRQLEDYYSALRKSREDFEFKMSRLQLNRIEKLENN